MAEPTLTRRARRLIDEARLSPTAAGLAAGATAAAGILAGRRTTALAAGATVALLRRDVLRSAHALRRETRSAADAATLADLLPGELRFGGASIEGDVGRLLVDALRAGAETVVECGCGTSTLLLAAAMEQAGAGEVVAFENEPVWAAWVRDRLETRGLGDRARVIDAPLREQQVAGRAVRWYDPGIVAEHAPAGIDLLLVDGPAGESTWSRWPAVPVLHDRLAPEAVVLMDDGRRRGEGQAAQRWAGDHDDLDLYWLDTVKGAWRLDRRAGRGPGALAPRVARASVRRVHPRPAGYGLGRIRR